MPYKSIPVGPGNILPENDWQAIREIWRILLCAFSFGLIPLPLDLKAQVEVEILKSKMEIVDSMADFSESEWRDAFAELENSGIGTTIKTEMEWHLYIEEKRRILQEYLSNSTTRILTR